LTASLDILSGRQVPWSPLIEHWTRGHLATAVSQATSKGRESVRALEKQMVAAHRRDLKETKGKKDSGSLKDKEREFREKLVLKMRRKAEVSVTSQEGRVTKVKGGGSELEAVSDEDLSDEELEDVSEEEEGEGGRTTEEELSEIDSSEELRLTSTDEEAEKGGKGAREKRRSRQEKERARARKQRELAREINRAERIAAREEALNVGKKKKDEEEGRDRSRARTGSRARTPTKYGSAVDYMDRRRRSQDREEGLGEFERGERDRRRFMEAARLKKVDRFLTQSGMRKEQVEKEMERAYEKYFSTLSRKEGSVYRAGSSRAPSHRPRTEQDEKEEQWERMTNPHLFGSEHGGGFRKIKAGQHYEEVQKEVLQTEIRIRERREQSRAASERPREASTRSRYSPPREFSRYSRASSSRHERW